jgi:chemotaxis protein CheD
MTAPSLVHPVGATRREHIVGIGEMAVGRGTDVLVAYALGSCLGVAIHDAVAGVGGLLHVMLPHSSIDPGKASRTPCLFVDSGMPALFRACYDAGASKDRLVVRVVGGSYSGIENAIDHFQIGKKNLYALRNWLQANGVRTTTEDVGGSGISRTLSLYVGTGSIRLRRNGSEVVL